MSASTRTSAALIDRANGNIAQLLRRFENIIALAPDQANRSTTAVESYQMEVETAALEMWLFGQLDTIGPAEAEGKTESDARAVAKRIQELGIGRGFILKAQEDGA